jgi:hypothetical protein
MLLMLPGEVRSPTGSSSASYRQFVGLLLPVRARRTNGSRADRRRVTADYLKKTCPNDGKVLTLPGK